jgi:hypothetical protein
MRTFVMLRKMFYENREVVNRLDDFDRKLAEHDDNIMLLFEYIKQFEKAKQDEQDFKTRTRIGFGTKKE